MKLPALGAVALLAAALLPAAEPALDLNLRFFRDLAETRSYSLGRPVAPRLTPDGRTVFFLRGGARDPVLRLYEFDVATGTERELLTPAQLLGDGEEVLTAEERARRERARVSLRGFTSFDLSRDGARLLVTLSGRLYVVERAGLKVTALPGENWIDPRFSPDGSAVAAVRAGELHVIELATNTARALTSGATATLSHGTAEFVAQEEMDRREGYWWSPDSQSLAYQQTDESAVEVRYVADPLQPAAEPTRFFYPRAGSANAIVRLGVIARTGGDTRWIDWDAARYPYLTRVIWREPAAPLSLLVQNRAQQEQLLLAADPVTGATRELLRETDPAWLDLDNHHHMPRWLPGGREFIWTTEARGSWQVELRAADGSFQRALTPPDFIYKGLRHVDAAAGTLYVAGGTDPRETQLWRFPLAGGPGTALTTARGQHQAVFAEQGGTFVHTYDLLDGRSGSEVLAADGRHLATLPSLAENPVLWPNVELTRTTGGERQFNAALVRPRNFQPGRKYPVILYVYAGPHTTVVTSSARTYLTDQWIADQGYIVVRLDGRGTPYRGRDWQRAVRGNLIDIALEDQVAGLEALGAGYPELDLSRVGVSGWSFGGYFSAMAAIRRPDIFKAAVVGAPVVTWEHYDTYYTERYLGLPQDDPEAYRVSSVLSYADQARRPLLLIHGLTDDNVYFQHTLQLADALYRAGQPYELLPMLGTHMISDPLVKLRQQQRIMEFFERTLRDDK
jgi:dipeptidyl-peptidase-4